MRRLLLTLALCLTAFTGHAQDADDSDRGFLTNLIEDNLSGAGRTVRIEGFAGALSSRATFDELTIADKDGVWLTIRDAALSWNRSALLRGRVEIAEMSAAEIIVPRKPVVDEAASPTASAGFSLPDLSVSIDIGKLRAARVDLGAPLFGIAVSASVDGKMHLEGGEGTAEVAINRVDGKRGAISFNGSYANATRRAAIDLLVSEEADGIAATLIGLPGRPAIELAVHGTGLIDDFTSDVALSTDGRPRVQGAVTLSAVTDDAGQKVRGFALNLVGDVAPLVLPEYQEFFGDKVSLQAEGARDGEGKLDLTRLVMESRGLDVSGRLSIAPDGLPLEAVLTTRIGFPEGGDVLLPIPGDKTFVRAGDLILRYDQNKDQGWLLNGTLYGFHRTGVAIRSLTLDGAGRIVVPQRDGAAPLGADGAITFGAQAIALADPAMAQAVGPSLAGRVGFDWTEGAPIRLSPFDVTGNGYHAKGDASITPGDGDVKIVADLSAEVEDMARFSALAGRPLGGGAVLEVTGTAGLVARSFDGEASIRGRDLSASIPELDRLLKGQSEIAATATVAGKRIDLKRLELMARTLKVSATGRIEAGASDVKATVDFSDLGVLGGTYRGAFRGDARLSENGEVRQITLDATGRDLAIGRAEVDGLLAGVSSLRVTAEERRGAVRFDVLDLTSPQIDLSATGTYQAGASDLSAKLSLPDLSVIGGGYGGSLGGSATMSESGGVRHITLDATGQGLRIGQLQADRVLAGATRLTLAARETAGKIEVDTLDLRNPQLAATATARIEGAVRTVDLTARLSDLALLTPGFPGPVTVEGRVEDLGAGYRLNLTGQGPAASEAKVSGTVSADLASADLTMAGRAQSAVLNLFIAPHNIDGPVSYDLRLAGPLALGSLSGRVALENGRFVAPTLGVGLDQIGIAADLSAGRATLSGGANVPGGGRLDVSGPVTLGSPFDGRIDLRLGDVRLRDPDLYDTTVRGSVSITGPLAGGAMIAGALTLGPTELRVPSTGLGAADLPEDIVHVAEPAAVRQTRVWAGLVQDKSAEAGAQGPVYGIDVTISAPERIFVRGRGLDAELGGALGLSGTTANIIPAGRFSLIRGRLDILGKRLDITDGQIEMQGAFVPYIHFVATTSGTSASTSIVIDGEASSPDITFESSPQLPQEEVIAQILFDRSLSSLSALQAAQLASAIATLAGRGGGGIVGTLRSSFGLDDLDLGSSEGGGASVRAGKHLSEKIYTDVTLGAAGQTQINLNLDVRKGVVARGTMSSDGESGVGLYYERDY